MKPLQLSCLLVLSQLHTSLGLARQAVFPSVTRASLGAQPSLHLEPRAAISTELSTCGYLNGDPDKERTADPEFNCRVDTRNGLWGFCPTTVLTASDCGLAGACRDHGACEKGCGMTDTDLTTFTCDRKSFCSFALLTFGVDQTYTYIACGAKATTENYLVTPLKATDVTTTSEKTTSQTQTSSAMASVTTSSTIETSESTSSETTNSSSATESSESTPIGAIIGGVLGGLVVVCVTVIAGIFLLRKNSRKDNDGKTGSPEHNDTKTFWKGNEVKEPQELEGWSLQEMPGNTKQYHHSPAELAA